MTLEMMLALWHQVPTVIGGWQMSLGQKTKKVWVATKNWIGDEKKTPNSLQLTCVAWS